MRAIRAHGFGGPEVLGLDEIPDPTPGAGELRVRVIASSVNPIDWKLREGMLKEIAVPFTTGGDFSGVVDQLGAGVQGFAVGDEVFGVAPGSRGAHAELVVVPAATVARKPKSLDFEQAASVPLTAFTAWQALFDQGALKAGESVFIIGASGGVGSFAVQFAKNAKAIVSGTASGASVERVRALGATTVVDYEKQRFEDVVKDAALCVDLVGRDMQRRAFSVVKRGGRLVSTVQPPDEKLAAERGIGAKVFRMKPAGDQLREIARQIDAGLVKVSVARVMPFEKTSEAEELNRRQEVTGKIVLRVAA
jgi:NADPH:quinone reductase-like Zn-dependent oxidoreductase